MFPLCLFAHSLPATIAVWCGQSSFSLLVSRNRTSFPRNITQGPSCYHMWEAGGNIHCLSGDSSTFKKKSTQWYSILQRTMPQTRQARQSQRQASRNPPLCPGISSKRALGYELWALENKSRVPLGLICGTYELSEPGAVLIATAPAKKRWSLQLPMNVLDPVPGRDLALSGVRSGTKPGCLSQPGRNAVISSSLQVHSSGFSSKRNSS